MQPPCRGWPRDRAGLLAPAILRARLRQDGPLLLGQARLALLADLPQDLVHLFVEDVALRLSKQGWLRAGFRRPAYQGARTFAAREGSFQADAQLPVQQAERQSSQMAGVGDAREDPVAGQGEQDRVQVV